MSSCLPCGGPPSETKLLARCYPPTKQLESAASDINSARPGRNELADLISSLRERPGHLGKVGADLEKRVGKDTSRIAAGDPKPRSSLLVSLAILKSLIVDFRADLTPLARHAVRIFQMALDVRDPAKGGMDLDVVGQTISAFLSLANYAKADTITPSDASTFSSYLLVVRKLSSMAIFNPSAEKPSPGLKGRTRMMALSGVYGSLTSATLLGASAGDFGKQANIIVVPLLANIFEAPVDELKVECLKVERQSSDDRRAPSIREYLSSEKTAPDTEAVLHLALRSLHDLVAQSQTAQLSSIVDAVAAFLDKQRAWGDVERCCWLAERMTQNAMLQYRHVVPTRLIELLVGMPDSENGPKQTTLLAMSVSVLTSRTSVVGLGVIYILDSLVGLTIKRVRRDPQDGLLPPLVHCIASLASHVYYADQVNEMIEEISYRLPDIPVSDKARPHIIRVLIHCMIGVMQVAHRGDDLYARRTSTPRPGAAKGKSPQLPGTETPTRLRPSRRTPISPDVWQATLPLLCESTYAVRYSYACALILYIERELPREMGSGTIDPAVYRFCHALHATVYTLAMSSCLGTVSPEPSIVSPKPLASPTPLESDKPVPSIVETAEADSKARDAAAAEPATESAVEPIIPESATTPPSDDKPKDKTEKGVSFNITEPTPMDTPTGVTPPGPPSRETSNPRSARRVSLPLNRLNSTIALGSFENVATPFDYSAILKILEELYKVAPSSALLTGVPMLFALDVDAGNELIRRPGDERTGSWVLERRTAIRETLAFSWDRLAQQWGIQEIQTLARKVG